MRLDITLFEKGLAKSRTAAKEMISSGGVYVDGKEITKASFAVDDNAQIEVKCAVSRFVGRGGYKLLGAIECFKTDVSGFVCADLGASTGGFCDCLLQHGAKKVYAIDVGENQLDQKLRNDNRLVNIEKTNIRSIEENTLPEKTDFVTADLSFISITFAVEPIKKILKPDGCGVLLIKPQFEAGKQGVGKNGLVKDKKIHEKVLEKVTLAFANSGFSILGLEPSPIRGGDGNTEYLLYIKNSGAEFNADIKNTVKKAF